MLQNMCEKIEEITRYIAKQQPWQQEILKKLRQAVHEGDPEVEESVKWSSPWFGHNGQQIAWMFCAKEWVNFSFSQGALLDGSHGLFEETDNKAMRTIKIHEDEEVPEKVIIKLIKDSAKLVDDGKAIKFKMPRYGDKKYELNYEYERFLKEHDVLEEYYSRAYYQQKGWIEWIEQAKQPETIEKRKKTMVKELKDGTYMPPKSER